MIIGIVILLALAAICIAVYFLRKQSDDREKHENKGEEPLNCTGPSGPDPVEPYRPSGSGGGGGPAPSDAVFEGAEDDDWFLPDDAAPFSGSGSGDEAAFPSPASSNWDDPWAGEGDPFGGSCDLPPGAFHPRGEDETSPHRSDRDRRRRLVREERPPSAWDDPAPIDLVRFSALTDKRAEAGLYQEIDIFMYTDDFRYIVDEFMGSEGRSLMEKASGYERAALGSRVTIILESPELSWSDKEDRFWNGGYQTFTFAAPVPESLSLRQIRFKASVYMEDVLSCVLNLIVPVTGSRGPVRVGRKDIRSAFISYSSMDRAQVASIVFGMKKVRPDMDIFFDVESMRSGSYWENVLKEEIEKRDILYLCWSRNARNSKYVEKEWRWAYKNKGLDGIEPVPLEAPAVCPPPAELNKLHFGDVMVYIMDKSREGEASLQCVSEGTLLRLKKGSVHVGRDISNDLVVKEKDIGNRQFTLSWNGDKGFFVRNMDPSRPTILIMGSQKKVLEGGLSSSVTVPCIIKAGPAVFLLH